VVIIPDEEHRPSGLAFLAQSADVRRIAGYHDIMMYATKNPFG
jgi:hypothetical protein